MPDLTHHSDDQPAGDDDRSPRAVVGVGESTAGIAALARARDLCRARGWRLDVITAWPDLGQPLVHDVPGHYSVPRGRAAAAQEAALRACGLEPTDPGIRAVLVNADPVEALVEHSRDAEVLVVGASGAGRSRRRGQSPIGASCLSRAACAVVVVREPPARRTPTGFRRR